MDGLLNTNTTPIVHAPLLLCHCTYLSEKISFSDSNMKEVECREQEENSILWMLSICVR